MIIVLGICHFFSETIQNLKKNPTIMGLDVLKNPRLLFTCVIGHFLNYLSILQLFMWTLFFDLMFWLTTNPKKAVTSCFSPQHVKYFVSSAREDKETHFMQFSTLWSWPRTPWELGGFELSIHRWTTVWVFKDIIIHSAHIETRCIPFGGLFLKLYDLSFRVQIL